MRHIQKRNEPRDLARWYAANLHHPNFGYDLMPTDLKGAVKSVLIAEQGELCAYTGRRIDAETSHIEHLKPQKHCPNGGGEDVSYRNMVACVPGSRHNGKLPYGAHKKDSWPSPSEEHLFVSPLRPGCERRFAFNIFGEVTAANAADHAATETIKRLGLDHQLLTQLREDAIQQSLDFPVAPAESLQYAEKRLARLKDEEQGFGRLEPFCFVLKQVLEQRVEVLKKLARRD